MMKEFWMVSFFLVGGLQGFLLGSVHHSYKLGMGCRSKVATFGRKSRLLDIWVEEAEDGFVDDDENLEDGETCLLALKGFASDPDNSDAKRLLCAGALIQRPSGEICDAWTGDAILPNGGPNLQLNGAVKVLDALFLHHLKLEPRSPMALRNFVLQCGSLGSENSCASRMAAELRGFRRLHDMVRIDSIYEASYYGGNLDGMVFDFYPGKRVYEQVARTDEWETAVEIWMLLPDAASIDHFMIRKEQEQD